MTLQAKLDAFRADFEGGRPPYNAPRSVVETMHRATAALITSGAADRALRVGDAAPPFTLGDLDGHPISSALTGEAMIDDCLHRKLYGPIR